MHVWLFDIDGTLISSGGAGQDAAISTLSEAFGIPAIRGDVVFAGRTDRAITGDLFRLNGIRDTVENWNQFQAVYLKRLQQKLQSRTGKVLDGVHELLSVLSSHSDSHLGLLTGNTRAGAEAKLTHYGLSDRFRFGGFGDVHADRDDVAQEAVIDAQRHLDRVVPPNDVWVVGDTPNDIKCARAIGANVIAVATGSFPVEELDGADITLNDLSQTEKITGHLGIDA